ncbi:MAG: hypothetical protein E7J71_06570 [Clostridium perfringens]|nr:hypothetical protein [Clostridium perfringens]MDU7844008.1 hypothetical protein [Clostridium perfringens]HAT4359072.1 hypothetical protein [Clostridium perfringens]HAT4361514.1 hypothetical protein [Clostridium perfringens]HAT4367958.1 hypothetical protein [Clostridium perfringens]HBZ6547694.1 hypothetical protein [Clostridium perfringens]
MITLEYYLLMLIGNLKHDKHKETINKWFKKKGVKFLGERHVYINCNIAKNEPHLIKFGENTTIAGS